MQATATPEVGQAAPDLGISVDSQLRQPGPRLNPDALYSGRAVFRIDRQGAIVSKDVSSAPGDPSQIPSLERVLAALEQLK